MKKLLAVLFAAVLTAGAFAQDANSNFVSGSWIDENWNAEWIISGDGGVKIQDSVTGELYYDFTDDVITDKKLEATSEGVVYSFACADRGRVYYFIKGLSLSGDLILRINPDWAEEDYQTIIKFKAPTLPTIDVAEISANVNVNVEDATAEANAAVEEAVADANAAIEAAAAEASAAIEGASISIELPSISVDIK